MKVDGKMKNAEWDMEVENRELEEIEDEQEEEEKQIELPKGTFLHFSGIAEGVEVTREDIKVN